jgi:hypothetical protein
MLEAALKPISKLIAYGPKGIGSLIPFHSVSMNRSYLSFAKMLASDGYLAFYERVLSIENKFRVLSVANTMSFKL